MAAALAALRLKALDRVFGGGAAGFLGAAMVTWLADQARDGLRKEPERLDLARLKPGETYLVTTRPPMGRKEAKVAAKHAAAAGKLEKMARPSRSATTVARRLAATQRALERAPEGSRKHTRRARKVATLDSELGRIIAPTPKELALRGEVERLERELAAYRSKALASAPKPRRPRVQVFR